MLAQQFDPELHLLRRTPFSSFLEREFKPFELFTYFHNQTKNWVISLWLRNRYGLMEDQIVLGPEPDLNADHIKFLKYVLKGPAMDPCKMLKLRENRELASIIEDEAEEADAREYCARKTGVPDPLKLRE